MKTEIEVIIIMANGRGVVTAGLIGLAMGVVLGNTMKKGYVTRQMRSTGRVLAKRARGTVNSWLE